MVCLWHFCQREAKNLCTVLASLGIGSAALADGFSVTGNLQFLPEFGAVGGQFITPYRTYRGTALNYTLNLTDNFLVGASLRPSFFAGQLALASCVGMVGVVKLNESRTGYVEGAIRFGSKDYRSWPFQLRF